MDYRPPAPPDPTQDLATRIQSRVRGLDRAIRAGLATDERDVSLWLPGPARERVALGIVDGSDPFDLCLTAALARRGDAVIALLDAGCEPAAWRAASAARIGQPGWNPGWPGLLCSCAGNNLTEPMRRIAKEISVDEPMEDGVTALMIAAATDKNSDAAFFLLLELGADPLRVSSAGAQPIMSAVLGNSPAIIAKLLELGADPFAKLYHGRSAADYAREQPGSCFSHILEAHELAQIAHAAPPARRAGL